MSPAVGAEMPRPRIVDVDKIVGAALDIADEEGLSAVSMRTVSERLGVVPMALYRHIDNKEDLLNRMADSVLSMLPEMARDLDWRAGLVELFVALRDLMVQHHGMAELMLQRTTGAPTMLRAAETALLAMEADGVSAHQAVTTLAMLQWSTLGAALHGTARAAREANELPPAIASIDAATYPAISRAESEFSEGSRRDQFRDGLEGLLNSVGACVRPA
ncbi:TetR/AcrR family transcriptional regulator C-terminal domain-containing protein [Mycobacterium sp.]|uniref:TetR/AcrR family transcriptional regulator n=1 Tax=Mycobacterium sp. TaxID=1785 RepID=UPI0025F7DC46|nr:TetR/AcrR family transcriptional regulator C-terminal domain-containing protein [Mycobacterium sp.]